MSYLIDTNVLSELRKQERCHPRVSAWFAGVPDDNIYLSVLVMGEIRRGIESIRRRDAASAVKLESWLERLLARHRDRILPVGHEVAQKWGCLNVPDPLPVVDGLLAATALVHDLTLVSRNVRHVQRAGVRCLDPFGEG